MATRSTIAIERKDGTVAQVYCHWDGYPEHNGKVLLEHYSDPAKRERLIEHGDISSLGEDIGEKHDFDMRPDGWTTFYGRDRGETAVSARVYPSWQDYTQHGQFEEFNYVLRCGGLDALNPVWEMCVEPDSFEPLTEVLESTTLVWLTDREDYEENQYA